MKLLLRYFLFFGRKRKILLRSASNFSVTRPVPVGLCQILIVDVELRGPLNESTSWSVQGALLSTEMKSYYELRSFNFYFKKWLKCINENIACNIVTANLNGMHIFIQLVDTRRSKHNAVNALIFQTPSCSSHRKFTCIVFYHRTKLAAYNLQQMQQCLSVIPRILLPFFPRTPSNIICLLAILNPMTTSVSAVPSLLTRLSSCVADLANSYAFLRLQLNHTKTEFILYGSRRNLAKLSDDYRAIIVGSSVIQCTDVVRDLNVLLDSEMSMQRHISKATSVCSYHLRRLRQIRNYVSQSVMAQLVTSLVITRIDYCNSILAMPVYLHSDWCHCNECKTRPLDWIDERTSVVHYNSCAGFRSCIASRSR